MQKVSTKACYFCGTRKPQPEMTRFTIEVESGRSKSTASMSTVLGAVAGNKRSKQSIENMIFDSNTRKYYKKVTAWSCDSDACLEKMEDSQKSEGSGAFIAIGAVAGKIIGFIILFIMIIIYNLI